MFIEENPRTGRTHAWCNNCLSIQPVLFHELRPVVTPYDVVHKWRGGDVVCEKCHYVITTFYGKEEK
jgi:hypothetical protein